MQSTIPSWGPTLLATKIFVPHPRAQWVMRPRLIERLDTAYAAQHKFILVSAPAGFGKTALVTTWGERHKLALAWLSLDDEDNDPVRFGLYFLAALQALLPDATALEPLANGLNSGAAVPRQGIVTALLNLLAQANQRRVIVLDDYHVIQIQAIHDALAFFIEHAPPGFQIVMTTRADPTLPLARWRSRGQLTEIRAADLQFTASEAAEFLSQELGRELAPAQVTALAERTEGWIAGLQLAAVSMRGRIDFNSFIQSFAGSHRYIMDYLVEEVLRRQPQTLTEFMLATSILERINADLANAVTQRLDARLMLGHLERENLFLIPLDDTREWYRYHRLFADVLQSRLQSEANGRVSEMHRRASQWFAQHNLPDEAIHYAFKGNALELAAQWIEQFALPLMRHGRQETVRTWLKGLAHTRLPDRPRFLLILAYDYFYADELDEMDAVLARADASLAHCDDGELQALVAREIAILRVISLVYRSDYAQAVALAEPLLNSTWAHDPYLYADLLCRLGDAYMRLGRTQRALDVLAQVAQLSQDAGYLYQAALALSLQADLYGILGELGRARALYEDANEIAARIGLDRTPMVRWNFVELGLLDLETNDLEKSAECFLQARIGAEDIANPRLRMALDVGHFRFALSRGDLPEARFWFEQAVQLEAAHFFPLAQMRERVPQLRLALWLAEGKPDAALAWVEEHGYASTDELTYDNRPVYWVLAELWIANQQYARALELLTRLSEMAERAGWNGDLVLLEAYKAIALAASGEKAQSDDALRRALTLGARGGYIRTFVERGESLRALLIQIRPKPDTALSLYVEKILNAFPQTAPMPDNETRVPSTPALVEPLSERELAVLRLVGAGKSNQEIATALVVTVGTVKAHLNHIFGKLGVTSRTQATARARALGLVDN